MLELWTVATAAEELRIPEETIRQLYRRGILPGCKVGRQIRFKESDIGKISGYETSAVKSVDKEEARRKKDIRKGVMEYCGGVNDSDYESLPQWCKRKAGTTLDDLTEYLSREGYYCESADEVYEILREELRA